MTQVEVLLMPQTAARDVGDNKRKPVRTWRMSVNPAPVCRPSPRCSLESLSAELLFLIFEQLYDIDRASLAPVRQTSRRLDALATPIKYRTLRLNERMVAPGASVEFPLAFDKINAYTHHVETRSDLDPGGTRRVLRDMRRLASVRWEFVGSYTCHCPSRVPADLVSDWHIKNNKTKLHIEGLPLSGFGTAPHASYLKAIPSDTLVTLKMASLTPTLGTSLEALKELLLASRRLEVFHHHDRGQGTRFAFAPGERLPAFRELTLRSYDWDHDRRDVDSHWDFSRMRVLKLIDLPLVQFLESVEFSDLAGLQTLHCEDFSAHLVDRRREATRLLYQLVGQVRALHDLSIRCHTQLFPVDGLARHGTSLQSLCFRDHVGFAEESRRCPTLPADGLATLSRRLVVLHTLELDMDVAFCEPAAFLAEICCFPRLTHLTLHVQTSLRARSIIPAGVDLDRDMVMRYLHLLLLPKAKKGAPWRSITINVGGWRRTLIRRMSEVWRQQNERGVFAERCFVFDRDAETGEAGVREEFAVEKGGRVGSRFQMMG